MLHTYTRRYTSGINHKVDLTVRMESGQVRILQNVACVYFRQDGLITVDHDGSWTKGVVDILGSRVAESVRFAHWSTREDFRSAERSIQALAEDRSEWLG